jgi:hypothetical protein
MERKLIEKSIGKSLEINTDYTYGAKPFGIDKLQDFLNEAKKNNATHIRITGSCWDGTLDDIDIETVNVTLENEEDFAKRVAEAESKRLAEANAKKAREKALYEELKLKYEK